MCFQDATNVCVFSRCNVCVQHFLRLTIPVCKIVCCCYLHAQGLSVLEVKFWHFILLKFQLLGTRLEVFVEGQPRLPPWGQVKVFMHCVAVVCCIAMKRSFPGVTVDLLRIQNFQHLSCTDRCCLNSLTSLTNQENSRCGPGSRDLTEKRVVHCWRTLLVCTFPEQCCFSIGTELYSENFTPSNRYKHRNCRYNSSQIFQTAKILDKTSGSFLYGSYEFTFEGLFAFFIQWKIASFLWS